MGACLFGLIQEARTWAFYEYFAWWQKDIKKIIHNILACVLMNLLTVLFWYFVIYILIIFTKHNLVAKSNIKLYQSLKFDLKQIICEKKCINIRIWLKIREKNKNRFIHQFR